MKSLVFVAVLSAVASFTALVGQVPNLINYQGKISVNSLNYQGSGEFRFALVNPSGTSTLWSNDGTSVSGGQPTRSVTLAVSKGLYSVLLGDSSVPNMVPISPQVFELPDIRLRVWFDDGVSGIQQLTPDQRVAPSSYLADQSVGTSKIANGAVGSPQLASDLNLKGRTTGRFAGPGTTDFQVVTGNLLNAEPNANYLLTSSQSSTVKLPASPTVGDLVKISSAGNSRWKVLPSAGQTIEGITNAQVGPWVASETNRNWRALASSGDGGQVIAAASGGQLYTSMNAGESWTAREVTRSWGSVTVSADGVNLLASLLDGVPTTFQSSDSGISWRALTGGDNRLWSEMSASTDGTTVIAISQDSSNGEIWVSRDSGTSWTRRNAQRAWRGVALSADGSRMVAVARGGQIQRSVDYGVTWSLSESSREWTSITSSADGQMLAATVENGMIYLSRDGGATWSSKESNRLWNRISVSASGTTILAAASPGQLYLSLDAGLSWTPQETSRPWTDVTVSGDGLKLFAVASNSQIYRATILPGLAGDAGSTAELQYVGENRWQMLSNVTAAGANDVAVAIQREASARAAGDAIPFEKRLPLFRSKIAQLASGVTTRLGVMTFGDSVAEDLSLTLENPLFRAYGIAGQHGGGEQRGITTRLAGGAVRTSGDFTRWITGIYQTIPSGGSFTYSRSGNALTPNLAFTRGKCYYIKEPGNSGSFKLQTSPDGNVWTDVPDSTAVPVLDSQVNLGIITFPVNGPVQLRVVGVTDTVKIIGLGWESASGVLFSWLTSAGGLVMADCASTPERIWRAYLADVMPELIFFSWKDDTTAAMTAAMTTIQGHISAVCPNTSTIYAQPYDGQQDENPATPFQNRMSTQRAAILEFLNSSAATSLPGEKIVWSQQDYMGDWSTGAAQGLFDSALPVSILSASISSGVITVVTAAPHGLTGASRFRLSEVSLPAYNGLYNSPTVLTPTTFTVPAALPAPAGLGSGGTLARIDVTHASDYGRSFLTSMFIRDFGILDGLSGGWSGSLTTANLQNAGAFLNTGGTITGPTRFTAVTPVSGGAEPNGAAAVRVAGGLYVGGNVKSDLGFVVGNDPVATQLYSGSRSYNTPNTNWTGITTTIGHTPSVNSNGSPQPATFFAQMRPSGTANVTGNSRAVFGQASANGSSTGTITGLLSGVVGEVEVQGSSTVTNVAGVQSRVSLSGAANVTGVSAFRAELFKATGGGNTGTLGSVYAFNVTNGFNAAASESWAFYNGSTAPNFLGNAGSRVGSITGPVIGLTGNGSPEGIVAAPIGSDYRNLQGGAGMTLWIKESGGATATGWTAK